MTDPRRIIVTNYLCKCHRNRAKKVPANNTGLGKWHCEVTKRPCKVTVERAYDVDR